MRSLNGEGAELDLEPRTTVAELREAVEAALDIPAQEQRIVYAGSQLDEVASEAWRKRRSSGALAAALGLDQLPDGAPLTLEHHGIQKGSCLNVVRKISSGLPRTGHSISGEEPSESSGVVAGPTMVPPSPNSAGSPTSFDPGRSASSTQVGVGTAGAHLAPQLAELNDLELLVLLRPLLRKRPNLRNAMLAEEMPNGSYSQLPSSAASASAGGAVAACGGGGYAAATQASLPFEKGDAVSVWSNSAQKWCDGKVTCMAQEATSKIPQGSVQVEFEMGSKWIAPADVQRYLRKR